MSEIAAAAERWRRIAGLDMSGVECGWIVEQDAYVLADAYVAEHPADDAEAVTEDWLRSLGGRRPMAPAADAVVVFGEWQPYSDSGIGFFAVEFRKKPRQAGWFAVVGGYEFEQDAKLTRADVRALLRALKITLTEKDAHV